jgi:protein TonB
MGKTQLLLCAAIAFHATAASAQTYVEGVLDIDSGNLPPGVVAPRPITSHDVSAADYPADSVRLEEMGTTVLRFMVLEDGNIGRVDVLQISGFKRLDDAAIAMVQSRWRYAPATSNGMPIRAWQHAKVVWQLSPDPLSPSR